MSGVVKKIKKTFKKLSQNKLVQMAVAAAAIYYTVGAAGSFFAAPATAVEVPASVVGTSAIGSGQTLASGWSWTSQTGYFATEAATAAEAGVLAGASVNAANAAGTYESLNSGRAIATPVMSGGGSLSATPAQVAEGQAAFSGAERYGAGGVDAALNSGSASLSGATADASLLGGGQIAAPLSANAPQTGMMGWLNANPMATLILGQSMAGAATGYAADKTEQRRLDAEKDRWNQRGLMGFDKDGNWAGQGVVGSQQRPVASRAVSDPGQGAAAAPQVAQQQAPQVPVPREQLPQMNKQGLIARG